MEQYSTTWRCNATIAAFADSIFDTSWGFGPTTSRNGTTTGHDGLFAVAPEHAQAYVEIFRPLCLRYSAGSGRTLDLPLLNIGVAKGLENDRVLLVLTATMKEFLCSGKSLAQGTACSLYVAVTRARASVALIAEHPEELGLQVWTP